MFVADRHDAKADRQQDENATVWVKAPNRYIPLVA